jgi:hypothetical protein
VGGAVGGVGVVTGTAAVGAGAGVMVCDGAAAVFGEVPWLGFLFTAALTGCEDELDSTGSGVDDVGVIFDTAATVLLGAGPCGGLPHPMERFVTRFNGAATAGGVGDFAVAGADGVVTDGTAAAGVLDGTLFCG